MDHNSKDVNPVLKIMYDNNYDELNRCRDWPLKVMAFTSALDLAVFGFKFDWTSCSRLVAAVGLGMLCLLTVYIFVRNHWNYTKYRNIQINLQHILKVYDLKDVSGRPIYEGMKKPRHFWQGTQGWLYYALYQMAATGLTILYIYYAGHT